VALAGLVAAVAVVFRIGAVHPTATVDHTHYVFSILFALVLTGYLALALTRRSSAIRPTPDCGGRCAPRWPLVPCGSASP